MSSLLTLKPEEARDFLHRMIADSIKVQASFVSVRSGTHVFVRGTVERAPDGIAFLVTDGKRAAITVDPTQASVCRRADSGAARLDPLAEHFFPSLEFSAGLILEFNKVEKLVVFAISADKSN